MHRDRTLARDERSQLFAEAEPKDAPTTLVGDAQHGARAINVTLHDVAAETIADLHRALDVHAGAGSERAKRTHVEGDAHDVGGEPVRALFDNGEAHTADADRVAVSGIRYRLRGANGEACAIVGRGQFDDVAELFNDSGKHGYAPVSVAGRATISTSLPSGRSSVTLRSFASAMVITPSSPSATFGPPNSFGAR